MLTGTASECPGVWDKDAGVIHSKGREEAGQPASMSTVLRKYRNRFL